MTRRLASIGLILLLATAASARQPLQEAPQEPSTPIEFFGAAIRPTEARTPHEELAGFHVPPGFQVDLVASEPQITKPLNMAFDDRGRLWVTQSVEYPYPARQGETPRDEIRILEDQDRDGDFELVHVFADQLNIPIGVLPYGDGCLCFSIPNILYLRDTDGDGKCDLREVVLGPFDTSRDTHGMVNSLRLGMDGWVYANHGYNNHSRVSGKDGHSLSMQSGNTFRFRPDGSRVEAYTFGQVNPFGSCFDEWGVLYTADCHSKPITQLLAGGCYESFGKPHDGLGFVSSMMDHLHGSTAIAGLAYGLGSSFPPTFQDNLYCGNVMTSRINRNHVVRRGATVKAMEAPDLLTSDDPWFRPVDLVMGPDGAMYVADFYNKIIGHYEVPLNHPGRDRERGRIFRIRYQGDQPRKPNPVSKSQAERDAWLAIPSSDPSQAVGAMWSMVGSEGKLPRPWLQWIASDQPLIVNHAALAAREVKDLQGVSPLRKARDRWAKEVLERRSEAQVRADYGPRTALRAIVEALGKLGDAVDIRPLLRIAMTQSDCDPILSQAARIALRDLLLSTETQERVLGHWIRHASTPAEMGVDIDSEEAEYLMPILIALQSKMPFEAMTAWLERNGVSDGAEVASRTEQYLPAMAAAAPPARVKLLFPRLRKQYANRPKEFAELLLAMAKKQKDVDGNVSGELIEISEEFWGTWLTALAVGSAENSLPLRHWNEVHGKASRQWGLESRQIRGTSQRGQFYSSLTHGEDYVGGWETGVWDATEAQGRFSFDIVGHNGPPDQVDHRKNRVQLIDAVTQEVLREAWPPRSDVAQNVSWDLGSLEHRRVRLRCIDEDDGPAYAWIGIGNFSLAGLNPTPASEGLDLLSRTVAVIPFESLFLGSSPWQSPTYADAGWRFRWSAIALQGKAPLTASLLDFGRRMGWADRLSALPLWRDDGTLMPRDGEGFDELFIPELLQYANTNQQSEMAKLLATRKVWWSHLLRSLEKGSLQRESLNAINETWWQALPKDSLGDRLRELRPSSSPELGELSRRVALLVQEISSLPTDVNRGAKVFKDRCSACHQVAGEGKVLGPQLDGVGQRGLQRLAEDILLPNQNVDEAFRMHHLILDDGTVLTGLIRERGDRAIALVDQRGESTSIPYGSIESENPSQLSLMPDNFLSLLKPQELGDLIGYLRAASGTTKGSK